MYVCMYACMHSHAGDHDSLIPVDFGRKTASNLVLQNVNVQFREYKNVDHEIAPDEVGYHAVRAVDVVTYIQY